MNKHMQFAVGILMFIANVALGFLLINKIIDGIPIKSSPDKELMHSLALFAFLMEVFNIACIVVFARYGRTIRCEPSASQFLRYISIFLIIFCILIGILYALLFVLLMMM